MARAKIALIGSGMIGGTLAHVCAREELGETVEALAAKADVKARARDMAAGVTGRITGTAGQVKEQAAARARRSAAAGGSSDFAGARGN